MLNDIEYREAIKIESAKNTKGSAPLEVLCDDGEIYFIKTTTLKHPPFPELVNEILCNYLCEQWGLNVAIPRLVKLPQIVVDAFIEEGNSIDIRYSGVNFNNRIFFGVQNIINATEFELYNSTLKNKHEYNKFKDPKDLIKIGIFDFWIGNKDRRPNNPNIIISPSEEGFEFIPIDHTAAFGYQSNYKSLKAIKMTVDDSKNIMSSPISKSILKFTLSDNNTILQQEILNCIDKSLNSLELIFQQIPSEWGFSKAGKARVLEVLSNTDRNKIISNTFYRFYK